MNHLFLTATIILVFSLSAIAQKSTVVDVPMSFFGTGPAIEVMVNGKGPFLFLIDTGAQGMARADTSLVQKLNISVAGQTTSSDGSAKKVNINKVRFETLSIGNLQFRDVEALSRNYNTASHLRHIDGILGFDLFADYLLTLDYPNKRVRIERGALPKPDGAQIINFEMRDGNPYIDVSIGSMKVKALIDSGNIAGGILFPSSLVKKLALASYKRVIGKGSSVSNEFEISEVRLQDTIAVGQYLFPEPTITFTDIYDDVSIGSAMLREFAITFDQRNHRVRFVKAKKQ